MIVELVLLFIFVIPAGWFVGYFILAPISAGFRPFTSPWQAVYEPDKHRLGRKSGN